MNRRRPARDDGLATVLASVCALVMIAVTGLALQLGAASLARHRAENAAETGSLAGAAVVLDGAAEACRAAVALAARNGASTTDCVVVGADVLVSVTVDVRLGPVRGSATGRARAGPVAAQTP